MKDDHKQVGTRGRSRRKFIRDAAAAALAASQPLHSAQTLTQDRKVAIFVQSDASDSSVRQEPVRWAVGELRDAIAGRGIPVEVHHNLDRIHDDCERVLVAPGSSVLARQVTGRAGVRIPVTAEALALAAGRVRNKPVLLATSSDVRGLVYSVLELADRVRYAGDCAPRAQRAEEGPMCATA